MTRANQTKTTGSKPIATKKTTTKTTTTTKSAPTKTATKAKTATTKAKTATTKTKTATTKTKTATTAPTERKERVRRVVNKESILGDFDTLLSGVEQQIELIKSSETKGGVKYFKTLNRQLKQLRGDVSKNIKVKRQVNSDMSKTSGFLKPVEVSKEVSTFAGWKQGEMHSRVDVTKFICNYVKSNDLQNPADRRQILPDKKLKTLLGLKDNMKEPLTYYSLQRWIQPHFVKSQS
jgi:chromatin remodeling complex protein RSC6